MKKTGVIFCILLCVGNLSCADSNGQIRPQPQPSVSVNASTPSLDVEPLQAEAANVREEAERIRRDMEKQRDSMTLVQTTGRRSRRRIGSTVAISPEMDVFWGTQGRISLVIPSGPLDDTIHCELMEDMQIMGQVLADKIHPERNKSADPYFTYIGGMMRDKSPSVGALYMDGYGILFLESVDYPLVPASTEVQETSDEAESDEVWLQARKKVYGLPHNEEDQHEHRVVSYDADQVESLRRDLVNSLKHASNIRNMDSSEWVIFMVLSFPREMQEIRFMPNNIIKGKWVFGEEPLEPKTEKEEKTVLFSYLLVRAQKGDIDDLAAGRINEEVLKDRIQIITY